MIDTHCHLTYEPLFEMLPAVLRAARDAGVDRMITVGTTPDDAVKAVRLAGEHDNIFAAAGIHPHYAHHFTDRQPVVDMIHEYAQDERVVAVGEMGLDTHYPDPPMADQLRVFRWQLEAAKDCDHPIIIHNRKATEQTIALIRESGIPGERFVFHCFTGTAEEHAAIMDLGAMISFTGITTFSNARHIAACAASMPLDRLMIETDSPYLAPEPHRKVRPNQPCYVAHVAAFIARQRGMATADFVQRVDANAQRFFRLA
jgi:TatD DNase family protein